MTVSIKKIVSNDNTNYDVDFKVIEIENNQFLRRIENVAGYIDFYYDLSDKLRISYHLTGQFVCPCARSLEDVYVDFDINDEDDVVFNEDEDGFYIYGDMSLQDLVYYITMPEIPIKVVKKDKIGYCIEGDFSVMSEEEYELSKKNEIDPRLEKLKEFKFQEDD